MPFLQAYVAALELVARIGSSWALDETHRKEFLIGFTDYAWLVGLGVILVCLTLCHVLLGNPIGHLIERAERTNKNKKS